MPSKDISLTERVQSSFKQLSDAATTLNTASDELGKTVADLDSALKKLNLGISSWVKIHETSSDDGYYYTNYFVGYDKISGKWGIGLRSDSGDISRPDEESEWWLFNDAPRWLRLRAIEHIPDLIEGLTKAATKATKEINDKLDHAKQLTAALRGFADQQ